MELLRKDPLDVRESATFATLPAELC